MTVTTTTPSPASSPAPEPVAAPPVVVLGAEPGTTGEDRLIEEDLLVEDVSIDGMCGVY
jgi:mycofactocin precursor